VGWENTGNMPPSSAASTGAINVPTDLGCSFMVSRRFYFWLRQMGLPVEP
jgi:hypothetical protein